MTDQSTQEQSAALTGRDGERQPATGKSYPKSEPKMNGTAIVPIAPRSIYTITDGQLGRMKTMAQMVASSSFTYGKLSEPDAFLVMIKGMELGLEPMAALASINIIQGLPTLSPQGMLALIHRTGELVDLVIVGDEKQCRVTMSRTDKTPHTENFTMTDATAQKLAGKDNWKKQPAVMLKWRAVAACARVVFPDIIQGLYTQEEIDSEVEYTDDGSVVPQDTPALPEPTKSAPSVETAPGTTQPEDKPIFPRARPKDPVSIPEPEAPAANPALIEALNIAVDFMYDNEFHRMGSIQKLLAEDVITLDDTARGATVKVLFHRAKIDFGFEPETVYAALSAKVHNDPVIKSYGKDWVEKLGRGAEQAWEVIQEYAKLTKEAAQPEGEIEENGLIDF